MGSKKKRPRPSAVEHAEANANVRERLSCRPYIDDPSHHFDHIDFLLPWEKVFPVSRESRPDQRDNLPGQDKAIRSAIAKKVEEFQERGIKFKPTVIENKFSDVWSGKPNSKKWKRMMRDIFMEALEANADSVLFESVSRAIRHPDYDRDHQWLVPGYRHFKVMMELLKEVDPGSKLRLMTVLPPGKKERSAQTSRGIKQKRDEAVTKREFRLLWQDRAEELRQEGKSYRGIAEIISKESGRKVGHMLIYDWLN